MSESEKRVRVLIVDDSALVRKLLTRMLDSDPEIEVVGTAVDPFAARDKIKQLNPDVLTLDVEMPRMDGITFLRNLMRLRPMPVVMVSSLTTNGADVTLDAMDLGAVDFVSKPTADVAGRLESYAEELTRKVKAAAGAHVRALTEVPELRGNEGQPSGTLKPLPGSINTTDKIIAIGASTGGTEALREVMQQMPATAPAIVITQHIPEAFSAPFAERLNRSSAMTVAEAKHGDLIIPGHAFVAPGSHHLRVVRDGAKFRCQLTEDAPVNRHRPSVDELFHSLLEIGGHNVVAAILTGMGADGARGMLELREAGAWTIAQDEKTSVVWGMPGEAVKIGAAAEVLPLQQVASALLDAVLKGKNSRKVSG